MFAYHIPAPRLPDDPDTAALDAPLRNWCSARRARCTKSWSSRNKKPFSFREKLTNRDPGLFEDRGAGAEARGPGVRAGRRSHRPCQRQPRRPSTRRGSAPPSRTCVRICRGIDSAGLSRRRTGPGRLRFPAGLSRSTSFSRPTIAVTPGRHRPHGRPSTSGRATERSGRILGPEIKK